MRLVQQLLLLHPAVGPKRSKLGFYWDLHKHRDFEAKYAGNGSEVARREEAAHYEDRGRRIRAVGEGDVMVVKTHEYKPELAVGETTRRPPCRRAIVVATRRDVAATVRSLFLANWQVDELESFLKASITRHGCWKQLDQLSKAVRVIESDYDELIAKPVEFLKEFISAAKLESDGITDAMLQQAAKQALGQEANQQFPGSKKTSELSYSQQTALKAALKASEIAKWQKENGYSAT